MFKIFYENEEFDFFFSTIENKIDINDNSYFEYIVNEESQGKLFGDSLININNKKIFVKKENKFLFETVIDTIQKHLLKHNHCNSKKVVLILLYNFSFIDRNHDSVKKINTFLNWKTTADLNQLIIFRIPNVSNYNLNFGEFNMGTFDLISLTKMCEEIGTDYVNIHEKDSTNNLSVKRNCFTIPIINIFNSHLISHAKYTTTLNEAFYLYFEELARFYFENFEYKFAEQQNLMTFLNDEYIDLNHFKLISKPKFISVFLNIDEEKNGWIIANDTSHINFNFPSNDNKYGQLINDLEKKYNFIEGDSYNELENTIYNFLTFCSKAKRYCNNDHFNEGFLHYIIALDLIFGDATFASVSVSSRVSICTYKVLDIPYDKNYKIIRNLYSERSKYVHSGVSVNITCIEIAEKLCREILFVFFRLNKNNEVWKMTDWLKKLDLLVAHLDANEVPSDEMVLNLGIEL